MGNWLSYKKCATMQILLQQHTNPGNTQTCTGPFSPYTYHPLKRKPTTISNTIHPPISTYCTCFTPPKGPHPVHGPQPTKRQATQIFQ